MRILALPSMSTMASALKIVPSIVTPSIPGSSESYAAAHAVTIFDKARLSGPTSNENKSLTSSSNRLFVVSCRSQTSLMLAAPVRLMTISVHQSVAGTAVSCSGVPLNVTSPVGSAPVIVRLTVKASSLANDNISFETDATSRYLPIAGPSRKVNSNG